MRGSWLRGRIGRCVNASRGLRVVLALFAIGVWPPADVRVAARDVQVGEFAARTDNTWMRLRLSPHHVFHGALPLFHILVKSCCSR